MHNDTRDTILDETEKRVLCGSVAPGVLDKPLSDALDGGYLALEEPEHMWVTWSDGEIPALLRLQLLHILARAVDQANEPRDTMIRVPDRPIRPSGKK
jgi:hypothetical protein